jgi:hypothetical protein
MPVPIGADTRRPGADAALILLDDRALVLRSIELITLSA